MIAQVNQAFQVYGLAGGIVVSFVSGFWLLLKFLMRQQSRMMEQHERERANWTKETTKALTGCCQTLRLVQQLMTEHHQMMCSVSRSLEAHIKESGARNATLLERTGGKGDRGKRGP